MLFPESGFGTLFQHWQGRVQNAFTVVSALLYVFIYVNMPVSLIPGGMHDDGFFMLRGMSIVAGDWMGAYNQYTLIKGAGYPLFLAAAAYFHIPATLGHALLVVGAVWLLATLVRKVFVSAWLAFVVFEVVLWNFGPESSRIVRDAIYPSQFLLCFSLLPLAFLAEKKRVRWLLAVLSGLSIGWLLITREEGAVTLPAFLLISVYFFFKSRRQGKFAMGNYWKVAACCCFFAVLPSVLVASRNYRRYLQFEAVDTQGPFAAAMSALESIDQSNERPFMAVSREVREKAYAVSPTFARLRSLIDDPGAPLIVGWKNAGCTYLPSSCGDYAVGWFMWGLRDAAALNGAFANAHTSAVFFRSIRNEVNAACRSGRLACHSSLVPLMPHLTSEELGKFPSSFGELLRRLLFLIPPALDAGSSIGTLEQMRDAAAFTNVYNFTPSPALAPVAVSARATAWARTAKALFISIYKVVLPVVLPFGFTAFLLCLSLAFRKRVCPAGLMLVAAAWMAILLRLAILAVIDVTSFGTLSNMYISLAFPVSCFAAIAAIPLVPQLLKTKRREAVGSALPADFRGVGESERSTAVL